MSVHQHSLFSWFELRHDQHYGLGARQSAVLAWFRANGPATDRGCREGFGKPDMNAVRPRITELIRSGHLEEAGETRDNATGRMVRVVRVRP